MEAYFLQRIKQISKLDVRGTVECEVSTKLYVFVKKKAETSPLLCRLPSISSQNIGSRQKTEESIESAHTKEDLGDFPMKMALSNHFSVKPTVDHPYSACSELPYRILIPYS